MPSSDDREPPRDSLDLRALRDGGRRVIPWEDTSSSPPLDPARSRTLGESWRERMKQEHLAVGAFSLIAHELASVGCDAVVLALITRAASDEVRHADVCKRFAQVYLGRDAVPERVRGVPKVPAHAESTPRERALLHVVEMCCLNETFTGVYLTEMLDRATAPMARAVIESLLEDEIDHGRVGWAHLAACCREGWGASVVGAALPSLLARAVGPVFAAAARSAEADDRQLERHGYLGIASGAALHGRALVDVVFPGFERVGVDASEAHAWALSHGWLPEG